MQIARDSSAAQLVLHNFRQMVLHALQIMIILLVDPVVQCDNNHLLVHVVFAALD